MFFGVDDLGVDKGVEFIGVFFGGDIDDGEVLEDVDLRCCEFDVWCVVYCFDYIVDELM